MNFEDGRVLALVGLAIVSIVGVIAWGLYWDYQKKRLEFDERRAMIDKGMEPPPAPPPAAVGWPGVRQHELQLKFAERRLMIEKGLPIPEEPPKRPATSTDMMRRGVLMFCAAVGIGIATILLNLVPALDVPEVADAKAWGFGLAPIIGALGLGHIVAARVMRRWTEDGRHPGTPAA